MWRKMWRKCGKLMLGSQMFSELWVSYGYGMGNSSVNTRVTKSHQKSIPVMFTMGKRFEPPHGSATQRKRTDWIHLWTSVMSAWACSMLRLMRWLCAEMCWATLRSGKSKCVCSSHRHQMILIESDIVWPLLSTAKTAVRQKRSRKVSSNGRAKVRSAHQTLVWYGLVPLGFRIAIIYFLNDPRSTAVRYKESLTTAKGMSCSDFDIKSNVILYIVIILLVMFDRSGS